MAENITSTRSYEEILGEIFFGKDAALDKYARVRKTLYEMELYLKYGLDLCEVEPAAKAYFSKRFLSGQRIEKASKAEFTKAMTSLRYAAGLDIDGNVVETGCRQRCRRLMIELNSALADAGLDTVRDIDWFLDYLTFDYGQVLNDDGSPKTEPGYQFEIRIFYSDENRFWFRKELEHLFKDGLRMSMQDVYKLSRYRRKRAKKAPPKPKPVKAEA